MPVLFIGHGSPMNAIEDNAWSRGFDTLANEVQYPARGSADLAGRVAELLASRRAKLSQEWGLDHGTWSVLRHIRPTADVPVVQLSIDRRLSPADHLAIGGALAPLREQGVLIMASGNVTHNLGHAIRSRQSGETAQPAWATQFDREIETALVQHDFERLTKSLATDHGRLSHPSPDHYLPLLYAAGAANDNDAVSFPVSGWDLGSLSMRSVRFGS